MQVEIHTIVVTYADQRVSLSGEEREGDHSALALSQRPGPDVLNPREPLLHEDLPRPAHLITDLSIPTTLLGGDGTGKYGTENECDGRASHAWDPRSRGKSLERIASRGDAGSDADPEGCGRQYGHQRQDRDRKKDGARNEAGDDGRHGVLHRVHEPQPAPYKPTRHDEAAYQCGNAQQEPNHGSSKEVCPPYGTCGALVSQANPCRGCSPSSI